ncbi:MAG: hypothetical protein XE10_1392 [Methanoculleus marisnigri]|uniref:Uncharacterized protein n=1 Tax=Methanoculleus marisnigri TaxID=2198 RepID=A0A101ISA6_9EURY|nr:MAG: hypothetical protein XE10_1392 [Methanoculleus marisnigri]
MTPSPVTRAPRILPAVESGTRESALCTIASKVAGQHRLCEETVPLAQGHRVGLELLDEPETPEPPTRGLTGYPAVEVLPAA